LPKTSHVFACQFHISESLPVLLLKLKVLYTRNISTLHPQQVGWDSHPKSSQLLCPSDEAAKVRTGRAPADSLRYIIKAIIQIIKLYKTYIQAQQDGKNGDEGKGVPTMGKAQADSNWRRAGQGPEGKLNSKSLAYFLIVFLVPNTASAQCILNECMHAWAIQLNTDLQASRPKAPTKWNTAQWYNC
jgi:hypothetical protein